MKFTDGKTVWDTGASDWNWADWAEGQYHDSVIVKDYIEDGFDNSNPVKIGGVEYSAYRILSDTDPCRLSQLIDYEIEGFVDTVKYWLEEDGEFEVWSSNVIGNVRYRVCEEVNE